MHELRENEYNSFGRRDFWDHLRGQARALIIRWYPKEASNQSLLMKFTKMFPEIFLYTNLVPIRPVRIKAANILNASKIECVIKLYSFVFLVHYSC